MAAQAGSLTLRDLKTQRSFNVDLYLPDAVSTYLSFNGSGLAASTSPNNYRVPKDCVIEDISVTAAPTAVGAVLICNSSTINGGTVRWSSQLQSLNNRPKLTLGLKEGDIIQYQQF